MWTAEVSPKEMRTSQASTKKMCDVETNPKVTQISDATKKKIWATQLKSLPKKQGNQSGSNSNG